MVGRGGAWPVFVCDVPPSVHPFAVGQSAVQPDTLLEQASDECSVAAVGEPTDLVDVGICGHADGTVRSIERDTDGDGGVEDRGRTGPTCDPDDRERELGRDRGRDAQRERDVSGQDWEGRG